MKKKVLFSLCLLGTAGLQAQVGVNNTDPKASLHITPQKTDGTTAEGIIAPNLSRAQLIGKDARYTAAQKGAIVYVTAVDGTISAKTTKITTIGYYYFDGALWQPFSQAETIVPTEPWRVQGGAAQATSNTENIYQTGKVAIGVAQSSAPADETLLVNGRSRLTDVVVAGTAGAVYPTNYTMHIFGTGTLGGLWVEKRANLKENVSIGENLTAADNALMVSKGTTILNGATTVASTGSFTLAGNGAGANKYLMSDATGKGTWTALPAATVTTANNGLAMSGTTTQLGGALTKATTISGTAANTLTVSAPSIISGALRISSGTPAAGKFLTSDAAGNATWGTLPAATVTTANNGLAMSGTTTQLGGALTKATTISGTAANTLTVSAPSIISGALRISSGTPAAGKFLTSDAAGNATWGALPAPTVTTANNGLAMSGTTTQLGGALTKATTISGTAANTLTVSAPSIISGALRISSGTPGVGKYLASDAAGNATWGALPATATTEPWQVQGGAVAATTNAQNIYQTGSVGIGALTAVPAAYKLQVTGASNVTGNSRVASSTVVGAQTVGTTLGVTGATSLASTLTVTGATTLNGATTAKATNITGLMKYTNTVPAVGQYLRASAVDGSVGWATLPATATTEPWQVQGTTTAATTNAQNIYQTGSIGIGASAAVPAAYKLQVTGASNVTGNSRVGSSTVLGTQTVTGTQTVGSATSLPSGALFGVQTTAPNAGAVNSTKGFMYPRVTLSSLVTLAPMVATGGTAAEKLQHIGLTVYNVGGTTIADGIYFWNGAQWLKVLTEVPMVTSVIADLKTTSFLPHLLWNQPQNGMTLDFGTLDVKEDGSYALLLRLYGEVYENRDRKLLASMASTSIYIWVFRSGATVASDAAELSFTMPAFGSGVGQGSNIAAFTAALTVPNAKKGEILTIRIGTSASFPRFNYNLKGGTAPNAARSSLYYWKL